MTVTRGSRRGRRIVAGALAAAMLAGVVVTDQTGVGSRDERYEGSAAYAYLTESMDCLSYGWLRWAAYWLGTQFSDEDSASGQYRRACADVANEDFAGAQAWMDAYIDADPGRSEAESAERNMQLACIRSLDGDPGGAVQAAREAVALDAEDAGLYQLLYQFCLDANDARGAADALAASAELTADDSRYEEIGDLYLEAGDYEDAGRFYGLAMEATGTTDRLTYMRGTCNMLLGRYAQAAEDFAASEMSGSRYSQGICAMALKEFDVAKTCFLESMELGEQENESRLMLAVCRLEGGEYAEAERLLDEYVSAGGAYEDIAYYRASARAMQEEYLGAAEDYEAAVRAGQFRQESLFAAAQCRYFAGDFERAIEEFEQCIDEKIDLAESWYYLGLALAAVGEDERAAEALENALAVGEDNA